MYLAASQFRGGGGSERMTRGRKPVPTALKLIRGNPGHRPLNEQEPVRVPRLPSPPKELTARAKTIWRRDGRKLMQTGVITDLDEAAFAAYCSSYARFLDASDLLGKSSLLIRSQQHGLVVNPLLRIVRESQEAFLKALTEFGMTPSSRARLKVSTADKRDEFSDFLAASPSARRRAERQAVE